MDAIMRRIENEDQEERDEKIKAQQQVQGYIRDFLQEQQQLKQAAAQRQQDDENRWVSWTQDCTASDDRSSTASMLACFSGVTLGKSSSRVSESVYA